MKCKLEDIVDVTMGQSPKSEYYNTEGKGYPFLQGNRTFGFKYPTFDTYTTVMTKPAKAGDVIMSVRAPVGDLNITPVDMCLGRGVCSLRMKNGNQDFLFYMMKYYIPHLLKKESGTVFGSVNRNDINGLEVNIPEDAQVQKEIARYLEMIDDKIELNNAINNNLEQQAQTLFKSWFIDAPESSSWETGTFSDIIETMIAGDWGKDSPTGNNTEMVYCIRGADIPDVKSGNKGKMPTRFILPKNYAAKHLVAGDVVVEISGGSPTQSTGRIASISQSLLDRYDKGMVCTNFCKAMKPKSGYSMFVYYYWQYLYDKKVFFLYENGTTGIKNLDISGFIETEPIILPPAELVEKFDAFCHSIFNVIFANGLQNEQLANMRDALLPKLMSGEVDVSELDL
ncbi:MAG: restriction endonuclease subunit S [Clostridium sp.]